MSAQLMIRALGGVSLSLDGRALDSFPSRKAEALLIYLACSPGPHHRETLAEMLWDGRPLSQSLANLRSILSSLRRLLGPFLETTRHAVSFDVDSDYWVDAAELDSIFSGLSRKLSNLERLTPEDLSQLEKGVRLYRGDFLAGFHLRDCRGFDEWAMLQRERLQRVCIVAMRGLITYLLEAGRYADGLRFSHRLLEMDYLNEEAYCQTMLLLVRQGQRNQALSLYQTLKGRLADELGVPPAPKTNALYQRIRSAHLVQLADLPNLPMPLVGREQEVGHLLECLADPDVRLITVVGPGGIGKSSLSLGAVRQLAGSKPGMFLHGIRYIPLSSVSDTAFLIPALADGLQLDLLGGAPERQLADYLRPREMLLVLDNMEQLIVGDTAVGCTAVLDQLLREAPYLKLLVTSQRRLELQQERLYDLHGLPCPPSDESLEVADYPGVQMFLQRAQWARYTFQASAEDLGRISRICRMVEGVPLAIELAASAIRRFSCAEIEAGLRQSADFLRSSLSNIPDRHLSFRAAFDYSWRLLSPDEQGVLVGLSIFRGAFTEDAAAQVAGLPGETLRELLERSFLRRHEEQGFEAGRFLAGPRFEMHRMLRHFAAEKMSGLENRLRKLSDDHCDAYARTVAGLDEALQGPDRVQAIAAMSGMIEDVRGAWRWAVEQGRYQQLEAMMKPLAEFYWSRSWLEEGLTQFQWAAGSLAGDVDADPLLLACLRARQGIFLRWLSRFEEARQVLSESQDALQEHQEWEELAWVSETLGQISYSLGEYEDARQELRRSQTLFERAGSDTGVAQALNDLGNVISDASGDYLGALQLYEQSLAVYETVGDLAGQAKCIINLGATMQMLDRNREAEERYQQGIAICRRIGNRIALAIALNNLGQLIALKGEYQEAERILLESLAIKREIGEQRSIAFSLKHLAGYYRDRGQVGEAYLRYHEALAISQELGSSTLMADLLSGVAQLYADCEQLTRAAEILGLVMRAAEHDTEVLTAAQERWARLSQQLPAEQLAEGRRQGEAASVAGMVVQVMNDPIQGGVG